MVTKSELIMRRVALLYAIMFSGAVSVFIFLPGPMFDAINVVSRGLFPALPLASDSGKFWVALTASMMATITALSILIYRDVRKNYHLAIPIAVAKFTSSLMGLAFFIGGFVAPATGWNTLANGIILLTDLPLGIVILLVYRWVDRERA